MVGDGAESQLFGTANNYRGLFCMVSDGTPIYHQAWMVTVPNPDYSGRQTTIGGFFAWLMTVPNPNYSGQQTTIGGFFAWLVTEHLFNIELKENLKNNIPFKTNQK